jgi:hypothetical protein
LSSESFDPNYVLSLTKPLPYIYNILRICLKEKYIFVASSIKKFSAIFYLELVS